MTSSNLVLALSLFSFIVLAIVPSTNAQNSPQDFVSLHNSARAAVGVGPVSWDDTVAAYAQNYANQRIGDCQLVHSGGPYGENIFWGSGRDYSAADAVNAWVSEKQYYDYNSNTCASGHVCGHYTLVVWANSMKIGCARVRCNSGAIFITCNYSPRMPEAQLPNHVILPLLHKERGNTKILVTWLPITLCLLLLTVVATVFIVWRRKKYAELLDDWELEYGPHRFKYKDLFLSTQGFKEKELMGAGGFGRVYKGVLPTSKVQVAVKKVSHESRQGMKEFVAEIVSIGRLRHRNLVQLLGYCRRKGELLLVYDFMPNGSLDKFLYDRNKPILNWDQRFQIIKGVAAGLLYLHEEWEKVVVHRDIKASNVLLDSELNGRLGDFGLAKLCDRGSDPQTTNVVGTMGYIAPEFARTGKATTATDVFAFGAFLLEVGCGRRPIKPHAEEDELVLVDWVLANWQKGLVLETRDPRLGEEYCAHEIELVLKLGLLCSHPMPTARPNMRQVMQILEGDSALPELCPSYMSFSTLLLPQNEEFDGHIRPFSSPVGSISGVSGGR